MADGLGTLAGLDPDALFVLPLGVGYAFTRRFYHSSFLVACGGRVVLVDAPAPLRRVMWAAGRKAGLDIDLQHIDALYLTHLHGDHCNGVEEFAFWRMFRVRGARPRLYILDELRGSLWYQRLYAAMGSLRENDGRPCSLESYFDVLGLHAGIKTDLGIPGLVVEPVATTHLIPTLGFRMEYRGRRLGYSADTAFSPELIDFLAPCDMIIHECGPGPGHTPLESLMMLPADLRAKMLITHLEDDYDIAASPIRVLEEGTIYRV